MSLVPNIRDGDWTGVRKAIQQISSTKLGPTAAPIFAGLTLSGLTANRLVATDASKALVSSDLYSWVTETPNRVLISDDGDGTITFTLPQDIHTDASPIFVGLTLSGLTASRLMASDGSKALVSSDLVSWVTQTANQVLVADDSDGTITLSTPQDIGTSSTVTFGTVTTGAVQIQIAARPTLTITDTGNPSIRLFPAVAGLRLDLSVNANYTGSQWDRDDVGKPSALMAVESLGDIKFFVVAAAANPISWTTALTIANDGDITMGGALDVTETVTAEQLTSTDDITMAGLFTNTPSADDAVLFTIDGLTNDRTYAGAAETAINLSRDLAGSGSARNSYTFFRNALNYNYDYSGATGPEKIIYTAYNTLAYTGDIVFTSGFPAAVHSTEGMFNYVDIQNTCQIANSTTKAVTINVYGSDNFAQFRPDYNITGAGVVTSNVVGGRFRAAVAGVSITAGTPVINYYGGQFTAVGNATGTTTAYGGYFSATGADTNYGIYVNDGISIFNDDIVLPKTSGKGIKVDVTTPTFGWRDLLGDVTVKNTGGTRPALIAYRDGLLDFEFAAGEEEYFKYHIPHDYVKGTDIFIHYHWSTNGALVNGGTLTFDYEISYAKAHAQAAFPASVSGTVVSATASSTQYTQELTEVQISASSPSGSQIDTDDLEPDGIIICTAGLNANNLTVSSGGVPDPFIHYVDIHYQSTNIGTKDKVPDFYT